MKHRPLHDTLDANEMHLTPKLTSLFTRDHSLVTGMQKGSLQLGIPAMRSFFFLFIEIKQQLRFQSNLDALV